MNPFIFFSLKLRLANPVSLAIKGSETKGNRQLYYYFDTEILFLLDSNKDIYRLDAMHYRVGAILEVLLAK